MGESVMYDKNNIFAQIVRGEVPCDRKICENEFALSFHDQFPSTSIHALVIPKGEYTNFYDFISNADKAEQDGFWEIVKRTTDILGISDNFNILANAGRNAPLVRQTVFHFHLHIQAGDIYPPAVEEFVEELRRCR
jgi:diadenosine tetraphosphate (Ap4A) HIT family hydrolase